MALTKLRCCIERLDLRNSENKYGEDSVVGISTQKRLIKTKADLQGVKLSSYKLMLPGSFVYVPDTSRRGDKISLAFNSSEETYLVSSIYEVFIVRENCGLLADYLFMYFNRPEFDRFSRFNSWGSARETFSFDDLCDIELELPSIEVQQKYVDIYNAMLENQKNYERGLEDLKLVCDGIMENLQEYPRQSIGKFILRNQKRNQNGDFNKDDVRGFNNEGEFIKPMRLFAGDIHSFKIIKKYYFVYNSRINNTIKKLSVAFNEGNDLIVSPAYESFYINHTNELYPPYLYMLLQRESFARRVLFNSFGSSTVLFTIEDLSQVEIPLPDIKTQQKIANVYMAYKERIKINEKLKAQIKDICPILIRGSLEESN